MAEEGFKHKFTAFRTSDLISLPFHSINPNRFLKRRYEMKVIRIIATVFVFAGIAFIFACSEEKTASLEGNEDIAAVIQKLPESYENPKVVMEIYTEDAVLKWQTPGSGRWQDFKGLKEIEDLKEERGKAIRNPTVSIRSIKREADKAHVEYSFIAKLGVEGQSSDWKSSCSAELVKKG